MIELLDSCPNCFSRDAFPAHFTGSAFVVSSDRERALLHHHRKLNRWLQLGGHCDGEEDVPLVAQREASEESGIDGLVMASSRPFDLDIHRIPAFASEPPHMHYDVRYVLIAPEGAKISISFESNELRWFTADEMKTCNLDRGLRRLVEKWEKEFRSQKTDCGLRIADCRLGNPELRTPNSEPRERRTANGERRTENGER
jgi:8-oxo-dGTP pyrophosphatase MutT (NUDIX family)